MQASSELLRDPRRELLKTAEYRETARYAPEEISFGAFSYEQKSVFLCLK